MSVQALTWVLEQEKTTTGTDRLVLLAIANHVGETAEGAWEAWPGIDLLASEANVTRRQTVKDALARLKAKGLISIEVNKAPDERLRRDRRTNLYTINHGGTGSGSPNGGTAERARGLASRADGGTDGARTGARQASPKPSVEPSPEPSGEPSGLFDASLGAVDPAPKLDPLEGFEDFWATYPRRIAKGEARKAWPAAVKTAGSIEAIVAGAERYGRESRGTDPKYVAHPATWLRAERWGDEPTRRNGSHGPRGQVGKQPTPEGRVRVEDL